ncbi:DNA replication/repair protein RecF [Capnocytophaga sp. ARDL2]|uniref:DNA replication/repair protein RecF n=1 Tax=Capnocytophaga sp. ARDL2 TaxID=3238809 RepID=UPI003556BC4B
MYLNGLHIVNFKNISQKSFSFPKKINCFVGKNGMGKTNILDAIYYLSQGKSYFNSVAQQNIKHEEDFFLLDGHFVKNDANEHIVCSIKKGNKKNLKRNGKAYTKFSEHIGLIPLVIISPADQDLILEGSETRRKFIDSVISQQDSVYLQQLITYQKIISQRNALLKNFYLSNSFDLSTLEIYNQQLIPLAEHIHNKRKIFLDEFSQVFLEYYQQISGNLEQVSIRYESALHTDSMSDLLALYLSKDRALQYTSQGIHKDDLVFEINGYPIKKFGSQGQQKSFLIALKLAQFDFLKKQSGILPILLFDDIFDKLDSSRVQQIIQMVNQERFGQLFITDTHLDRTEEIVQSTDLDYEIFEIK